MEKWNLTKKFKYMGRYIHYDVKGNGAPIVIVHGTPWSSFNLRHLIFALSNEYTVFYYDLMGYGQSDKSEGDVSLGIQNNILSHLIDHWDLKNPYIIGHDFGGTTVLRTHLINNMPFKKIVLIDPVAISPWGSPFFKHVHKYEKAFAGVPEYIHEAIVKAYICTAAYKTIEESTLESITRYWKGKHGQAAFYRQIAQADSRFTDEIQGNYNSIKIPVLILWGEQDTWIPLEKGKKLNELIPDSKLKIIPDSGHLVIEEQPQKIIKAINAFLRN